MTYAQSVVQPLHDDSMGIERQQRQLRLNIRALMGANRVSQERLGNLLGLGQAAISRRLCGEVAFGDDELAIIAAMFGGQVIDLYEPARLLTEKACLVALECAGQGEFSFEPPPTLAVVANNH